MTRPDVLTIEQGVTPSAEQSAASHPETLPRWHDLPWLSSRRVLALSAAVSTAILLASAIYLPVSWGCLGTAALIWALAAAFAGLQPRSQRIVSLNIFGLALVVNMLALFVLTAFSIRSGGPFLGPDSTQFLQGATALARRDFRLDVSAPTFFQTYNVAQFYLFGSAIRFLHADLFALQTLNVGLIALLAPVTHALAQRIAPPFARAAGAAVALHPSIVMLGAVDLLKDPSIVLATLLAAWALLETISSVRLRRAAAVMAIGIVPLLYLRMGRFFVFTYFEIAVVAAGAWVFLRRRRLPTARSVESAAVLAVGLLVAEVLPLGAGWPTSAGIFTLEARVATRPQLQAARTTAAQSQASGALPVSEVPSVPAGPHGRSAVAARPAPAPEPDTDRIEPAVPEFSLHTAIEDRAADQWGGPSARAVTAVLNIGRRFLGPFPWIAPRQFDFGYLQANAFLMYPGVLCWYAFLPVLIAGWLLATRDVWRGTDSLFSLCFLWIFGCLYVAPYALLDFHYLPYRQRDGIFPILLVVALAGLMRTRPSLRRWYVALGAVVVAVATSHLALRAWLAG